MSSNYILTPDHLREVVEYFEQYDEFTFDFESMGAYRNVPTQNQLTWLSMATHGRAVAIPFGHPNGDILISRATRKKNKLTNKFDMIPAVWSPPPAQMRPSEVFEIVEPLFFSDRMKIAHNATFDLVSMAKYYGGELPPPPYSDTIVLQWLLDENLLQKGLKDLVKKYYQVDYDKENVGKRVEDHPFSKVARYAYMDAKFTWLLYNRLQPRIEKQGLQKIRDLEMDVLEVLLSMNQTGALVDEARLMELEPELSDRLIEAEGRIYKAAGQKFNLNAPAQKAKVLYASKDEGGQGLKVRKLTKGGQKKEKAGQTLSYGDYSTDAETLEYYPKNPVVAGMLEYQEVGKMLNTYVRGYLGDANEKDKPCRIFNGRIHADLVQYGTVTGRFSCREPNLQNIPAPNSDLGKEIRGLFIPPPGHRLIVADYAQIELVVLASYCGRGALFDGFMNGVDAHTATAAAVFGVTPEQVTKDQRSAAKALNFAIVYGAGPDKVAAMAGVSVKQAKELLAKHQKAFPEIYKFKDKVIAECRRRRPPHLTTLMGRRRRLPTIHAQNYSLRGRAERQAVNSLIQGSAADLIKFAMVRLHRALPDSMRLILSVHDELVVTVPEGEVDKGMEIVREAMEGPEIAALLRVPPRADVKVVDRWSEAK